MPSIISYKIYTKRHSLQDRTIPRTECNQLCVLQDIYFFQGGKDTNLFL
nr:MAG TPA: hypothetical protein [Caudoviricetes sp.]